MEIRTQLKSVIFTTDIFAVCSKRQIASQTLFQQDFIVEAPVALCYRELSQIRVGVQKMDYEKFIVCIFSESA